MLGSTLFWRLVLCVVIRQKYLHSASLCQSVIKSTIAANSYKPCRFDGFNYSNYWFRWFGNGGCGRIGMKSVRSASFGVVCCSGCCFTIFAFGKVTVRVTVFVSGLAIFFANATTLLLVLNINSSAAHFVSSSTRSISLRMAFKPCYMSCSALLFIQLFSNL